MSDQGTGITITWGSSYFADIQSLSLSGPSREAIDITTFATTGGREFVASDVYDPGELEAEILLAPGTAPPGGRSRMSSSTTRSCTSGAGLPVAVRMPTGAAGSRVAIMSATVRKGQVSDMP